jgi:propionate CoA-transferase
LERVKIAPGIDLETNILQQMAFRPRIAADLKLMDKRLFSPAPMNLCGDMEAKERIGAEKEDRVRRVS